MEDFFGMQKTLLKKIREKKGTSVLDSTSLIKKEFWTREMYIAMNQELSEMLDWINYKSWKTYKTPTEDDIKELKIELIDLQHFLINLYIIWDMGAEEVKRLFTGKHKENIKRQERNY